MARRLRADLDQRQLGLFGEGLALGVKPTAAKALPVAALAVARPTIDLPKNDAVSPTPFGETETPSKPKRLASLPPEIVRPPEAASLLSVSLSLLKKWRIGGGGPKFVRLGGRAIGYRRADLSEWIERRTR
jgi:predicted DNA-binding transcriptional regulator AlpA